MSKISIKQLRHTLNKKYGYDIVQQLKADWEKRNLPMSSRLFYAFCINNPDVVTARRVEMILTENNP